MAKRPDSKRLGYRCRLGINLNVRRLRATAIATIDMFEKEKTLVSLQDKD